MAKKMSNRNTGSFETVRFSTLLEEGASALFLLLLAGFLLAPRNRREYPFPGPTPYEPLSRGGPFMGACFRGKSS